MFFLHTKSLHSSPHTPTHTYMQGLWQPEVWASGGKKKDVCVKDAEDKLVQFGKTTRNEVSGLCMVVGSCCLIQWWYMYIQLIMMTISILVPFRFRHNTPSIDLHVVFIRLLATYVAIIALTLYVLLQWLYSWRWFINVRSARCMMYRSQPYKNCV